MNHFHHADRPTQCCRDPDHRLILGVCAGIARSFGWPLWLTRVGAVALGWFFTVPTIIAYFVAALLMPERTLCHHGNGSERGFWRSHHPRS